MKTLRRRIRDAGKAGGVDQLVVERDYLQSYILRGLGDTEELRETLVFKGGSALKKVHFGEYRFSEDLDFSMIEGPKEADLESAVRSAISRAEQVLQEIAPIALSVDRYEERDPHPGGQEAFTVRAQFPWQRQPLVPVKLEVTHDEPVLLPAPHHPVQHGYGESLEALIRTYSLEEIGAEKLRATQQTLAKLETRGWTRSRARDYYDLWHLVREPEGRINWEQVSSVLAEKCRLREVAITSAEDIFEARLLDEVRLSWDRTLGPFVPELPEVETVIYELHDRLAELLCL
ncbi:MAG: nucleotidyl transferase AbiEii/AbiGii toxin family protein [Myxococcota bacterium]